VVGDNLQSVRWFLPETILIVAVMAVILWDLFAPRRRAEGAAAISIAALLSSAVIGFVQMRHDPRTIFEGLVAYDPFANFFKAFFGVVTALIVVFSMSTAEAGGGRAKGKGAGEFYSLLLVIALGMDLMASARNLLMLYLSLEIVSVLSFVMVGLRSGDKRSSEASLKYVIFGGASSGVMLYGMSWLFGLAGSLDLPSIFEAVRGAAAPEAVFVAVVCVFAGIGYKISAAPFHMWAPDVYEGAPTPVTAFLSVGPKAAGFAMLLRFFTDGLGANDPGGAEGLPWAVVGGIVAALTMTVGNFSALGQRNMKRLLAFSSIAHAGYMLMAFSVFSDLGMRAIVFYVAVYCVMNVGAFLVVHVVAEQTGSEDVSAFDGLGARAPLLAIAMAVFLFSLTGLPPLAGFVGKVYLFASLVKVGGPGYMTLALVGILNSVVSLFYYARVLRAMYLTRGRSVTALPVSRTYGYVLAGLVVPTVFLGLYWPPLFDLVDASLTFVR
jgi:NADH-quinone oxidoreductase subunit N